MTTPKAKWYYESGCLSFCCFWRDAMYSEIVINKAYHGINPILFGYQTCEPSHAYGPVARTHWLFHFVVSGHGIFRIGGRDYQLSKGMMFVIPPFVETYYEADAEAPWEYIWIGFTGEPPLALSDTYTVPQALRIFESILITLPIPFPDTTVVDL